MQNKISVIIPVYNTPEQILKKCINSVLKQTFKNLEIIIINDGSNSKISEVLKKFKNKDTRIKLIEQKNQGEAVARNIGIETATTNWISFVDSDDFIELNMYEKMYDKIKENKKQDIIIFDCYVIEKNKKTKNTFYNKEGTLTKEDIRQIELQNIEKGVSKYYPPKCNISVVWARLYNKQFIIKNNLNFIPNVEKMPDAIFNMYAFELANNIEHYNDYSYYYIKNDFSITHKYSKNLIEQYEFYIKEVQKYISKYNKDKEFKEILNIKIVTSISIYIEKYFFNKNNKKNYTDTKKEIKQLISKSMYTNAMRKVKNNKLGIYQKLMIFILKIKFIFGIKILKKIKDLSKMLF